MLATLLKRLGAERCYGIATSQYHFEMRIGLWQEVRCMERRQLFVMRQREGVVGIAHEGVQTDQMTGSHQEVVRHRASKGSMPTTG